MNVTHFSSSTANATSQTNSSSSTNTASQKSQSKSAVGGIAGGVTVAIIALLGIGAGFIIRRRRQRSAGIFLDNLPISEPSIKVIPLQEAHSEQSWVQEHDGKVLVSEVSAVSLQELDEQRMHEMGVGIETPINRASEPEASVSEISADSILSELSSRPISMAYTIMRSDSGLEANTDHCTNQAEVR